MTADKMPEVSGLESPKTHRLRRLLGNKKRLLVVGVVLVVVVGAAAFVLLRSDSGSNQPTYEEIIQQAQDYRDRDLDNRAKDILLEYMARNPKEADKRYLAEQYLSDIYQTAGDSDNALLWGERALQDSPEPSVAAYLNLATIAVAEKNKEAALKYYQQAQELNDKTPNPNQAAYKIFIPAQIEALNDGS